MPQRITQSLSSGGGGNMCWLFFYMLCWMLGRAALVRAALDAGPVAQNALAALRRMQLCVMPCLTGSCDLNLICTTFCDITAGTNPSICANTDVSYCLPFAGIDASGNDIYKCKMAVWFIRTALPLRVLTSLAIVALALVRHVLHLVVVLPINRHTLLNFRWF